MKKVIVVGASTGIGRSLAERYVTEGCKVGITGRRRALLEGIQRLHPDQVIASAFDVNELACELQLTALAEKLGGVDIIIYSAGVGEFNKDLDFAIEKQMVDTNVVAFTQVADWAYHYFKKQGAGSFASITSMAGMMGSRHAPAYNASKAYQINYLKGLRQKVRRQQLKVTITDLRTGFVDTPMAKAASKFWVASAQKAADQMVQAIERKVPVAYITKRWKLVGFFLRLFA
jgi:short-subunit dehydrogenase